MADIKQETWWVLRAQAGEREALTKLLQVIQAPLYRYITGLVQDNPLAEDILQEVFLGICRHLRWLREPELFRPWAYRIASRETFKQLKRERRWKEQVREEAILDSIPAPAPSEELRLEWIDHLPERIAALSPASRAVVVLHYQQELSLEEIALALEIPVGTVKSRLAYGLERLRRTLVEQAPAVQGEGECRQRKQSVLKKK